MRSAGNTTHQRTLSNGNSAAKGANATRQQLNSLARCDAVSVAFTEIEKVLCYDTIVAFDVLVSSQVFLGLLGMIATVVAMRSFVRFHFENRTDKMTVEKDQSVKMGLDMVRELPKQPCASICPSTPAIHPHLHTLSRSHTANVSSRTQKSEIERKNTGDIEMNTNSLFGSTRSAMSSGRKADLAIDVSAKVKRGKKGKVQW